MLETFPCSFYCTLLSRGQVSSSQLRHVYSCVWIHFVHMDLTNNCWGDLIDMPVEYHKRPHIHQITLFIVSFIFLFGRDVWPMID